ncbi:hypothetical protein QAD02_008822 [Eretmocerus hayati]|uniref:Uncharacterized protein n=1 Tax=Eretmocerus hayati TaxID=131215 RepID=A0ACC2N7K4_9HYME|nr:hypothetical protein QAD02_008822 [Eretmocerus hayati]
MAVKRKQPSITAWLKKENTQGEEIADEVQQAKELKQSVRVCLEPLSGNIIAKAKVIDPRKVKAWKSESPKREIPHDVAAQSTNLRRSARHLPTNEKQPVEKPWSSELYIERLSPILFKGHINYVSDFNDCANICDTLLTEVENSSENLIPIGFDLEWPFSFQTGSGKTALAQICMSEKVCHLLHLYQLEKLPASLIALLSHSRVKLVGVNIKNDVWKLTRDFKEFPGQKVVDNNCLDCGPYANVVFGRSGRWSLERLTAYLLKKKIDKNPAVRRSKWHIHPLSKEQKLYAATDAYVSLLLHLTIERQEALNQIKEEAMAAAAALEQDL